MLAFNAHLAQHGMRQAVRRHVDAGADDQTAPQPDGAREHQLTEQPASQTEPQSARLQVGLTRDLMVSGQIQVISQPPGAGKT